MIPNGSITLPSRKVLLVENSPSDRQLLRAWMTSEMIETYEAIDIITAMSALQKYSPNLILLQLRLPTFDGFEVIRRLKDDPRTRNVPVIFVAASALTSEKAKGIDMGAVDFVSKPFDPVELLARVNSALRTRALLDLLEQRAHLDGLTELANRFALKDEMPQIFATCRDVEKPFSVLIADIDHFKKVNDEYGHAAGDEVLRRMAVTLRASVRPGDFLARYGGEEFVALCPACDETTALATAERFRQRVSDLRVGFRNATIKLTSSLGVCSVRTPFEGHPSEVLEQADLALYRAKSGGRDAIWYWNAELKGPVPSPASTARRPDPAPAPPRSLPPSRRPPAPAPANPAVAASPPEVTPGPVHDLPTSEYEVTRDVPPRRDPSAPLTRQADPTRRPHPILTNHSNSPFRP